MATEISRFCSLHQPAKTTLFKQESKNGVTYRIPALIYIDQTFLAFAEKRTSPCDSDADILVMRRGTFQDGSIQWSSTEELTSAQLSGHRTMNPCPVYENASKTLFLFFVCIPGHVSEHHQICTGKNQARLCYITSSDKGLTWSPLTDLTKSVIGEEITKWATFAVGPGHGTQMMNGRLIIPAYAYYIHKRCPLARFPLCVKSHAFVFYSDDHGNTWHFGEKVQEESCECEMAEIIDSEGRSHLYCNARSTKGHRVEAFSKNSGVDFCKSHFAQKLVEPRHGCQGSVLSFPVQKWGDNDQSERYRVCPTSSDSSNTQTWLLYVHPTNKKKRRDLGVYLNKSPLHTTGWEQPWIIHQGPSGYSDVAQDEKGLFACLMECGVESELEEIAFAHFHFNDMMEAF
ncbi:sialidase-3-like [Chanos chanos]|uniref:exo-alpha-sialidase n=1 Tax=Chanos chanos TaxID=29144 RepID=A0A6J2W1V6_CHACN|nr:sialidase-3 [Chanos chanos]